MNLICRNWIRDLNSQAIKVFGVLLFFIFISCERYDPLNLGDVDCYDCYTEKPEWVRLNVKLTINSENQSVPLVIFVGNIEDADTNWIDISYTEDYWVDVKPNRYYSVTARYKDGNKIIYAVDGDKIKLKHTDDSCDEPCYYSTGGYIDVQLKK